MDEAVARMRMRTAPDSSASLIHRYLPEFKNLKRRRPRKKSSANGTQRGKKKIKSCVTDMASRISEAQGKNIASSNSMVMIHGLKTTRDDSLVSPASFSIVS